MSVGAMLLMATPALVDDGGRRRNRGSSFTESGIFGPTSSVGLGLRSVACQVACQ
jgi:hypothetical protein